jgi:NAD(P)-dependent dehydrogenase (short-subunit alcohol dehydrogenase family)
MSTTMIVTGASRGIGAAIARDAASAGVSLVLNARSGDALDDMADSLDLDSARIATVAGDVGKDEVCERIVSAAMERFGRIHVVVNNAGILDPIGALDTVPAEDWVRNLVVNVAGPALLSRRAVPFLRESRGRIINISSGAAVKAVRGWSAYCTSKAALNHFTRALAAEYPEITAVAISPGMTATDMQLRIRQLGHGSMPRDEYRRFVDAHRRGELRSPEAVARAVVALSLNAPPELSGEFVTMDDPRVMSLL